jgi:hypothetical protein
LQKVDSKELELGKTLVESLTTEKFDPGQYSDTYAKELEKLIEAKSKGQKVVAKEEEEKPEETTDILEALKASLKVKGKPSTSAAANSIRKVELYIENVLDGKFIPHGSYGINHTKHNLEYGYLVVGLMQSSRKKE